MELADTLNWFFEGIVEVNVKDRLELTRGSTTLILTLPKVIGARGEPTLQDICASWEGTERRTEKIGDVPFDVVEVSSLK